MGKFQIDFLDLDEREIFDAGTVAFVQNQMRLLFANRFNRDSGNVKVSVTQDKVRSTGETLAKVAIEYSGENIERFQIQQAARMLAFHALTWRHGLPVTPYVIEID